ncbi:MAG: hypothetical protein KBC16_03450 [Candidatus Pacebacteria bacterium]|nr:hypothetical protein [Candidatus Paceibacterota bacterium]
MKRNIYWITTALMPLAVLSAGACLFTAAWFSASHEILWYRLALLCIVLDTLLIQLRIRVGFRLPRTQLFFTHLACSLPFLVLLILLSLGVYTWWLAHLALLLFPFVLVTGTLLYTRGIRVMLQKEKHAHQ